MPTISVNSSLGPNGVVNPLVGSVYEYLPFPAQIEAAILADTGGQVSANMSSGTDILLEGSPVDELAAVEPIQYPEFYSISDVAAQGERISITLRETAGAVGPTLVRTRVRITPL